MRKRKIWKETEIQFLRNNINTFSNKEFAETFDVSINSIENVLKSNGIKRNKEVYFFNPSKEEIEFIKENVNTMKNIEFAKMFDVTESTISSFLSRNNIKRTYNHNEIELLASDEEFRDLKELNGKYRISNYGRVLNVKANKIMKTFYSHGYERITLSPFKGKKKKFFIHKLVALAFVKKVKGKKFVDHKDGDTTNNYYENLRWATHSENIKHNFELYDDLKDKLSSVVSLKDSEYKTMREKQVHNICRALKKGKTVASIARKYDVKDNFVSGIKNKKYWRKISDLYF